MDSIDVVGFVVDDVSREDVGKVLLEDVDVNGVDRAKEANTAEGTLSTMP